MTAENMRTTQNPTGRRTVIGVFDGPRHAEMALNGLRDAGFKPDQVSVVARESDGTAEQREENSESAQGNLLRSGALVPDGRDRFRVFFAGAAATLGLSAGRAQERRAAAARRSMRALIEGDRTRGLLLRHSRRRSSLAQRSSSSRVFLRIAAGAGPARIAARSCSRARARRLFTVPGAISRMSAISAIGSSSQ